MLTVFMSIFVDGYTIFKKESAYKIFHYYFYH